MDCAVNGAPIWAAKRLPISRGVVEQEKHLRRPPLLMAFFLPDSG